MLKKQKKSFFSESALIALVPALAYGSAYFFESGYLKFFGIPNVLVKVSIENFCNVFAVLAIFIFLGFMLIEILSQATPRKIRSSWHLFIGEILLLPFCIIILIALYTGKPVNLTILTLGIFGFLSIYLKIDKYKNSKKGEFIKNIRKEKKKEPKETGHYFSSILVSNFGVFTFLSAMLIFWFFLFLFPSLGELMAKGNRSFLVTSIEQKDYALIRFYPDNLILVEVNKNWGTATDFNDVSKDNYLILPLSEYQVSFSQKKLLSKDQKWDFLPEKIYLRDKSFSKKSLDNTLTTQIEK